MKLLHELLEFKKWNEVQPKSKNAEVQKWRKPEEGWIKCNFDGAWEEQGAVGRVGIVIRDAAGDFVAATALKLDGISLAMLAEIAAAREAVLVKVILGGDALMVIAAIQNNLDVNHGSFGHVLTDIRRLLEPFQQWKVSFVRRDANTYIKTFVKTISTFKFSPKIMASPHT
ncbi:unnamed protein product [Malus baccata var. baccata]